MSYITNSRTTHTIQFREILYSNLWMFSNIINFFPI
nr:MAG TPA: hypothetical protein [Caudoviricetes sp.]